MKNNNAVRELIEAPKPAAHTPTPWAASEKQDRTLIVMGGPNFSAETIAVCAKFENAAFIVRAVNAHESLVNCLKNMTDHLNYLEEREGWAENVVSLQAKVILKIIARAQGRD